MYTLFFQVHHLDPTVQIMSYETAIGKCNTTMGDIINIFAKDMPTLKDMITRSDSKCKKTTVTFKPTSCITFIVKDN